MNPQSLLAADIQRPLRALLELVEAARSQQCEQLLGQARSRAEAVRRQAREQARTRLRQAFFDQRRQRAERVAAALARLATQRRLHQQQHTAALLALAWAQLPAELNALWLADDSRVSWVAGVLTQARQCLAASDWILRHAPGWPAAERAAQLQGLAGLAVQAVQIEEDPRIGAGLRITAGGNVIDGTLAGLLAGRAEFEARLLRALELAPGAAA